MSITSRPIVDPLFWPLTRIGPDIAILLLAYVILYSGLIVAGHGVPYVMDNNETFSSLNHAYNLWHFDFSKSMGLADEAMSPFEAAHAVTHTHQGNFPRLFSFVLYAVGARTPESHIWITTLTVGSASAVMAYVFFRRLGGRLFAAIAVAFLLTNYLMFAQWQVNTYRVWHGFLLFAALLCVHGISEWPVWRWVLGTILVFAALFYGELVSAAFVAISTALYAAWVHRSNYLRVLGTWFVQGFGAALALGVLVMQLVMHLGWQDFLSDLKLTFFARNLAADRASLVELLNSFYGSRNIVFLYNINPEAGAARWLRPFSSLFEFQFAYYTPVIATFCCFVALAVYLAPLKYPRLRFSSVDDTSFIASIAVLVPGLFLLLLVLSLGSTALPEILPTVVGYSRVRPLSLIAAAAMASLIIAFLVQWISPRLSLSGIAPGLTRSALAGLYLMACAGLIGAQAIFYDQTTASIWRDALPALSPPVATIAVAVAALFGCFLILCGRLSMLGEWARIPPAAAPFLVSGAIAYFVTFYLSGGYVVTGYLVRLCPFISFHVSTFLALGFFVPAAAAIALFRRASGLTVIYSYAGSLIVCIVTAIMTGAWLTTQANAYRLLPPNQLAFIDQLRGKLKPGDGIVSNTYVIPFGIYGGTWAYSDPDFLKHLIRSGEAPDSGKNPYLWFADRRDNAAYNKPVIYVCFMPASTVQEIRGTRFTNLVGRKSCSTDVIQVQQREPEVGKTIRLPGYDQQNGLWAIYGLSWQPRN